MRLLLLAFLSVIFISCDGVSDRESEAKEWVEQYSDQLQDDIIKQILRYDFGYGMGNELIRRAIERDVVRQVSSGLEWEFDIPENENAKITATASITVEMQTEEMTTIISRVTSPPLQGTITASVPYELRISRSAVQWSMDEAGVNVTADVSLR